MPLSPDTPIFVLSGAGLSKASGIPTFRDADGLWEGHDPMAVATPQAWSANQDLVRRFYDERRALLETVSPNAGHAALARLQAHFGPERVTLCTQNIDGLLQLAGATDVIEMHGSLRHLRCSSQESHPWIAVRGSQDPRARCSCGAPLRPAVVWFGEIPRFLDRIEDRMMRAGLFVSVGTSGQVYPAAGLVEIARYNGVRTIEVNPEPTAGRFDESIAEPSEDALPRLVDAWIGDVD